jgi:hypothetical protein
MKPVALSLVALMILSTSAFAADKHSAVAPESPNASFVASAPDVSGLPESLRRVTLWAYFLTNAVDGELGVYDLAAGTRFVDREMRKYEK